MMLAKASTIIYLWLVKWKVNAGDDKIRDTDLTGDESWDIYQMFKIINFACAGALVPLFGYYSDKLALGQELIVFFGLRAVATMSFFMLDSPHGDIVMWTFVAITTTSSLQGIVIDSLYSKRLPGDVRASMQSVKAVVGNLGHLTFVLFSLSAVDYFESIHKSMCLVSLFDASMFFIVIIMIIFAGFDNDFYFGKKAREEG